MQLHIAYHSAIFSQQNWYFFVKMAEIAPFFSFVRWMYWKVASLCTTPPDLFVYIKLKWRTQNHATLQALTCSCTWLPLRLTYSLGGGLNTEGTNQRQVAPPATRMYLSSAPWRPGQEVSHWPSDLPWWPFLSPCCLAGRKDAVCCP